MLFEIFLETLLMFNFILKNYLVNNLSKLSGIYQITFVGILFNVKDVR